MSFTHITHAIVLAAGCGVRMRPLTDHTPKPLLPIHGITPLARCVQALVAVKVTVIVVNYHHLGAQIVAAVEDFKKQYPNVTFHLQDETEQILETGGGIRRALPLLGDQPFFTINAADFWEDGEVPALLRMQQTWDPAKMDVLLLLHAQANIRGDVQKGDFVFSTLSSSRTSAGIQNGVGSPAQSLSSGCAMRNPGGAEDDKLTFGPIQFCLEKSAAAFMTGSVTIAKQELFIPYPENQAFSQNVIWRELAAKGRLYGLLHDAPWYHLTTPADYAAINAT